MTSLLYALGPDQESSWTRSTTPSTYTLRKGEGLARPFEPDACSWHPACPTFVDADTGEVFLPKPARKLTPRAVKKIIDEGVQDH